VPETSGPDTRHARGSQWRRRRSGPDTIGRNTVKKFVVLLLVLVGLGAIVAVAIKATQE